MEALDLVVNFVFNIHRKGKNAINTVPNPTTNPNPNHTIAAAGK